MGRQTAKPKIPLIKGRPVKDTVKNKAEKEFKAALRDYGAATADDAVTAAENRMIGAIAGIQDRKLFPQATKVIMLIPITDERAGSVIDVLAENAELCRDMSRYADEKPERVGNMVRSGALESVDSALSAEHLKTLSHYTRAARLKMALES